MKLAIIFSLIVLALAQGITFTELQDKIKQTVTSPFVHLMFVYDSTSPNGPLMGQAITEIGQRKEGYFKIIPIDCNTEDETVGKNFPYCSEDIRPKLPALMYTEPSLNQVSLESEDIQPKTHQYAGQLQEKALYEFAIPLMKLYSIQLRKGADWNKFKQTYPDTPKVIYFTDKDKISPYFKSLTAHFRNTIAFAHVFKNSSLCQQFGVTTFPTLLLQGKEKIEVNSNLLEQVEILKSYEGAETTITIQEYLEITSDLAPESFQEKVMHNPNHILVHVPSTDGTPHPEWKKSQDSFKRMFEYFDGTEVVKELGVKHKPAIVYYPKSLTKKQLKKTIFYSNTNFRGIYDQISGLIQDFTVPLSSDIEMQQLTALSLKQGRFVVVLFHQQDISLSYRVLSNDQRFKESLVFFRMKDPDHQVMKKFNLKKLPTLLIMTVDNSNTTKPQEDEGEDHKGMNLQVAEFKGKFNYDQLEKFLNIFTQKPKEEQPETSIKEIKQIKSKKQLGGQCSEQGCYLLLIDGSQQKKQANQIFIKVLEKATSNLYQTVSYLDAKCHSELIGNLQIYTEDLPTLIFLNPKFQKYSRLVGRIQQKSVETFIAKVRSNKGIWRQYSKLIFQNKDCIKQHQRLKNIETSGFEMSAEQAQILSQVRLEQQQKKQEAAVGDRDSKKKRRKRRPKEEEDSQL